MGQDNVRPGLAHYGSNFAGQLAHGVEEFQVVGDRRIVSGPDAPVTFALSFQSLRRDLEAASNSTDPAIAVGQMHETADPSPARPRRTWPATHEFQAVRMGENSEAGRHQKLMAENSAQVRKSTTVSTLGASFASRAPMSMQGSPNPDYRSWHSAMHNNASQP